MVTLFSGSLLASGCASKKTETKPTPANPNAPFVQNAVAVLLADLHKDFTTQASAFTDKSYDYALKYSTLDSDRLSGTFEAYYVDTFDMQPIVSEKQEKANKKEKDYVAPTAFTIKVKIIANVGPQIITSYHAFTATAVDGTIKFSAYTVQYRFETLSDIQPYSS